MLRASIVGSTGLYWSGWFWPCSFWRVWHGLIQLQALLETLLVRAASQQSQTQPRRLSLLQIGETATPFPPEFMTNPQQTNGVIFIGVLIVVIIVAGTIGVNRNR